MMNKTTTIILTMSALALMCFAACNSGFLDVRPDKMIVVPETLDDLQALLDAVPRGTNDAPAIGLIASDDFYATDNGFMAYRNVLEQNVYLWKEDPFEAYVGDWAAPYNQVFYANVVLDKLLSIGPETGAERIKYNSVKGSALFMRSLAFYHVAQLFAAPYDGTTASQMPGIPLRLSPLVDEAISRGTLEGTYSQITGDLDIAHGLLPEMAPIATRPSKLAVDALLARAYLSMGLYDKALWHADRALGAYDELLDYNSLDLNLANPFAPFHKEVIYYGQLLSYSFGTSTQTIVHPEVYGSYHANDLRREAFTSDRGQGSINFTGNYTGSFRFFGGLATDELYLVRAECRARSGDVEGAMEDLNGLLVTRWAEGTFVPLGAATAGEALALVLGERRKGLLFRGLRWADLRRLNKDPRFAKTLTREVNGVTYTLPPNDPRYVFPLPHDETGFYGLEQNPRN